MRFVRIDAASPEGSMLELHPRLTVLLSAPTTVLARVESAFEALLHSQGPGAIGEVEVHGVRLTVEDPVADVLALDDGTDPFLQIVPPRHLGPERAVRSDAPHRARRQTKLFGDTTGGGALACLAHLILEAFAKRRFARQLWHLLRLQSTIGTLQAIQFDHHRRPVFETG